MKNILLITILSLVAWFTYLQYQKYLEEKQYEHDQDAIVNSVNTMAKQYNANNNWAKKLTSGKRERSSAILTIEMEEIWLNQTILFIGSIVDARNHNRDSVTLTAKHTINTPVIFYATDIYIELECPHRIADSIIKSYKKDDNGFFHGVALIANITKIKNRQLENNQDGTGADNMIHAYGHCIDGKYIAETLVW